MFRFFEKATLIKQVQDQYTAANTEYSRAQETLKDKARGLRQMGVEYKKANARYLPTYLPTSPTYLLYGTGTYLPTN